MMWNSVDELYQPSNTDTKCSMSKIPLCKHRNPKNYVISIKSEPQIT